jgi:PAS domain S-box-containing protein
VFKTREQLRQQAWVIAAITAALVVALVGVALLLREIRRRKRVEATLRESEAKYRNLFENMAEEVHFWQLVRDEAGRIKTWRLVDANPPTLKTWGRTSVDEIKGKTTDEIFGPGATEHYMAVVQKIATEGVAHSFEDYFAHLDKHFRFTSVPLGEYFITTGADITGIKKTEEALLESEEKARNLIKYAPTAIFEMDFNATRFLSVNEATCDLSGYTREELLAMSPLSLTDEQSTNLFRDWARRKLSGEKVEDTAEFKVGTKDGRELIMTMRASAFTYREGEPVTVLVIGHDITERKRAEEALRESEERYRRIFQTANEGIWVTDGERRTILVNQRMADMLGYTTDELQGRIPSEFLHAGQELVVLKARQDLTGGATTHYEFRFRRKDGSDLWVISSAAPVRDSEGRLIKTVSMLTDITERKQAEEALRKAHDELERRVRERTSELSGAVEKLRIENIQRKELEGILREKENQVRFFASQCLTAQETERKRVAGELHDSIAASLAAIRLRIDRAVEGMKLGTCGPEPLHEIASAVTVINNEVRRIMADLRPSILDDLGILAALTWFCREYQTSYSHIAVEKKFGIEEREVPDSLKTPIFRICQEAMNNIAKHSRASLVNLSLKKGDARIGLSIQDNGQGFDLETVKKGMGLSTMRERAQLSGGAFDLKSTIGKGTTIRASWTV